MTGTRYSTIAVCAVMLATVSASAEETTHPTLGAFKKCTAIKDDVKRLVCFDTTVSAFDFEKANQRLQEADRLKAEADQLKKEQRQLVEASKRKEAELEAKKTKEFGKRDAEVRTVDRINSSIKRVIEPRVGGKYLVLENGMVWQIQDGGRTGPIKTGMELRITKTKLGGYLLTFELTRRTFRVKRIN